MNPNEKLNHDSNEAWLQRTHLAVIDLAKYWIGIAILLNGGALLSIGTFLQAVWENRPRPDLQNEITWFVVGLTAAAVAIGTLLSGFWILYENNQRRNPDWADNFAYLLFAISILLILGSYGAFMMGGLGAAREIGS